MTLQEAWEDRGALLDVAARSQSETERNDLRAEADRQWLSAIDTHRSVQTRFYYVYDADRELCYLETGEVFVRRAK